MDVIESEAQLDALPKGTILLTAGQNPIQKDWRTGDWRIRGVDRAMPTHLMIGFHVLWRPSAG